jgi:hypothetical protein
MARPSREDCLMDDERRPDDRFGRIREALVALGLAPADDRQEQARRTRRVLEVEQLQREERSD